MTTMQIRQRKPMSCHFLVSLLLSATLYPTLTLGIDPKDEFNYIEGSGKDPSHWGELRPEWSECKVGHMQSPVDISSSDVEPISIVGELSRNYKPATGNLSKIHEVEVKWEAGSVGSIQVDGTTFNLVNIHWHSPSEHRFNGNQYDLELHMVHKNVDQNAVKKITVISHLYKVGCSDPFLSKLTRQLVKHQSESLFVVDVDPRKVKRDSMLYYRYMGSLTTPPCFENVTWIVDQSTSTVSDEEVRILKEAIGDKGEGCARPVQSIYSRKVKLGALVQP